MGRPRSWLSRSEQIMGWLEWDTTEIYVVEFVKFVFRLQATQAKELMVEAGAKPDAIPLTITRIELLNFVRNCAEAWQERERQKRLAEWFQEAEQFLHLRAIVLPVISAEKWMLLHDLVNVSIEPGKLTVVFSDARDLCAQLQRFGWAAGNDWELFEKLCDLPPKKEGAA